MDLIRELVNAFVLLIRVGVAFRVVYCFVRMASSEEEAAMYKRRSKNTVLFYVLAESVWQLKELVLGYY